MMPSPGGSAYIPLLPEPPPDPAIAALLAPFRATYGGELLNYHRVMALDPRLFELHVRHTLQLMGPLDGLTRVDRLVIGLVVSRVVKCPYLAQIIEFYLRRGSPEEPGMSVEEIATIREDYETAQLRGPLVEVCRLARRVAENPRAVTYEDRSRVFHEGLSDQAILGIVTAVAYYTFLAIHIEALGIEADLDEARVQRILEGKVSG